jgi:hypothetical protein
MAGGFGRLVGKRRMRGMCEGATSRRHRHLDSRAPAYHDERTDEKEESRVVNEATAEGGEGAQSVRGDGGKRIVGVHS